MAEGAANLILSLILVNILPEDYKVFGVIVATVITTLLVCDTVEPYVVFKNVFGISSRTFMIKNYALISVFILCLFVMNWFIKLYDNIATGIVVNGLIALGVSLAALGFIMIVDKAYRYEVQTMGGKIAKWWRRY